MQQKVQEQRAARDQPQEEWKMRRFASVESKVVNHMGARDQ
jgi:hypothetical protein